MCLSVQPPLGKLTFWFFGKLMGYDPSKCEYVDLNRPYGPECKYYLLRGVAASFSTLTLPLMFYCARNFGSSVKFAFLAAMLVCFDMLNLGEGRLILMDSQLIFWLMATLYAGQEWWRRLNAHELWLAANNAKGALPPSALSSALRPLPQPQRLTLIQRYLWAVVVGICCGNAINVKMTGLVTPAVIALESFWGIWFLLKPIGFLELLTTLASSILTYSAWFGVSFWLFVNSGPNKVEQEFMTPLFQATLVNSDNYDPTGNALREWRAKEGFWWTMITHNARMIKHNANILAPHPWQTTWYEWVLNLRGVAYYGKDEAHRYHTQVYLLGNPAVIWSVLAAIILSLITLVIYVRYRSSFGAGARVHSFAKHATFCLLAYLLNLLPYFGVARSTFIYHYSEFLLRAWPATCCRSVPHQRFVVTPRSCFAFAVPALVYAQLVTPRFVETLLPTSWHGAAVKLYLLGVLAMFLYHSAWLYAYPILPEAHDRRRWLPRWN